jgi:hypothetical protein
MYYFGLGHFNVTTWSFSLRQPTGSLGPWRCRDCNDLQARERGNGIFDRARSSWFVMAGPITESRQL